MVDDSDGDDGVGGAGLEGEREAVRSHGEQAAVATDSHEVLAKVTADLKSIWLYVKLSIVKASLMEMYGFLDIFSPGGSPLS